MSLKRGSSSPPGDFAPCKEWLEAIRASRVYRGTETLRRLRHQLLYRRFDVLLERSREPEGDQRTRTAECASSSRRIHDW